MKITKIKIAFCITAIVACITACLFGVYKSQASTNFPDYKQTIYNQDNGLGINEINALYQAKSGYVWVGTEGGLYRFNGKEFKLYNLWDTEKEDVYYINDIFQDSKDRLWVCTNNFGLFYIDSGVTTHFTDDYYNGVKSINTICETEKGVLYVATTNGLFTVNEVSNELVYVERLEKHNVQDLTYSHGKLWGIYNGNMIFCIDENGVLHEEDASSFSDEELSTITSDENGTVYVGTIANDILKFSDFDNVDLLYSNVDGINNIYINNDRIYVCADSGIGFFNKKGNFSVIKGLGIQTYFTDMLTDYEGNLWMSSKKYGVLYMSHGKFSNINRKYGLDETGVNAVAKFKDNTYLCTDEGLIIINKKGKILDNELTKYLEGTSIKDIIRDKNNNIWIATYRKNGVVKYSPSGDIVNYNKSKGLISNLVNSIYELNNGNIAVCTEDGLCIIGADGTVKTSYNQENGLDYPSIISLYENEKGVIYAGSDGGGLYVIDGDNITNYTQDDGLNSNVITCITEGKNGLWIGTNNGLTYYNDIFRAISNIDFSNSITSIFSKDDLIYIVGSKGLIYATEDELLGTAALSERYFSSGDGIEGSITSGSHNFIDDSGLYICTTKGALYFDNNEIFTNEIPPRITVSEVNVDGEVYYYNQLDEELTIPSDTQRVEISFSVLSFSNRENIKVQYQLEGFDSEPIYLDYDDNYEAVYTNLEGGTYFFKLSAANGDGVESTNDMTFKITKELGFFEYKIVRIIIVVLILAILSGLLIIVFKYQIQFIGKNKELENLTREHEDALKNNTAKTDYLANMSNEIKTPVNAIISSANNILKDVNTDENTQSELSSIIDKSQDVISMVDETIQLARLESGSETVLEEPYSISTLICDISDNMLNKLTDKPIKFLVDLGKNLPDILIGDFDKIKNVLEIILDNSIKYTKEGSITLSVECYDYTNNNDDNSCNLVFSISDTGTGISEERLEHIFEIYYIDESKKSVVNVGNGVSMSIAKKLSDIMEGELVVDSTYGAGSTFTFSLTQEKPDVDGKSIPLNENTIERVSREEAERMRAPELKILLVDDVEISRNVAYDIISSMEIKCDTASSGISAIDMVINNDYDLIFMDIGMPVMNGVEVLKEIKELSDSSYADLPVIAMSEDVIGKNRNDLIEEGFSDVILKPFDLTVLAGIVIRFADPEKVKYKSNDVTEYISESRYGEGLKKLEEYMDVLSILDKIGGNIDVYNRILSTFYNQNKDAIMELDEKLSSDFRGFRNKIHNVRNGCQNIGAFEAAEIILKFEDAINSGNKNYVRNNTGIMYDCIQVLTETIKEYLDFVNEDATSKDKEVIPETGEQGSPKPKDYDPNMDSAFIIDPDRQEIPEEEEDIHEEEDDVKTIDIDKLRTMREATYLEDINTINNIYLEICNDEYVGEDVEFLKVLGDSIEKIDFVEINDLLGTYISLKSSL